MPLIFYKSLLYNKRMNPLISEYLKLNELFTCHGYKLYLVGGTVRDYLLNIPLTDMDAVTDAKPDEMKEFLPDANYSFAKFGSVSLKIEKKVKFDITTLREEKGYSDARHPGEIHFIKDLSIDVKRRDFTINALYLDENLKVIDYVGGENDLNNRILRMIGNPIKRLEEDPLRIFRAIRFASDYPLTIDKELDEAISKSVKYIDRLNIEKIKLDLKKCHPSSKEKVLGYFKKYHINLPDNVIE